MRHWIIAVSLLSAACLAIQPRQEPKPLPWKNLRVLPRDISRDDLTVTMRAWSQSLGVSCDHCHVQFAPSTPGGRARIDFTLDSKPQKAVTRGMLVMTRRMNTDYIANLARSGGTVTCYTCHRGKVVPDSVLPPQPKA